MKYRYLFVVWILFALCSPGTAGIIFETAQSGPSGPGTGGGNTIDSIFFLCANFEIEKPTRIDVVGGHFMRSFQDNPNPIFGAIVAVDGPFGIPNPHDLSGDNVLGTTLITPSYPSDNDSGALDIVAEPGWYAVVFGSGKFGATGAAAAVMNNISDGVIRVYSIDQRNGSRIWQGPPEQRLFVEGVVLGQRLQAIALDATAEWNETDGYVLDEQGSSIATQEIPEIDLYRRGILEFDISEIPAEATILEARLTVEISGISYSQDDWPAVIFHGYPGNGVLEPNDAARPYNMTGFSGDIYDTDEIKSFDLDTEYIESLLGQSTHLGLLVRSAFSDGQQLSFWSSEMAAYFTPPTLEIRYDIFARSDFDRDYDVDFDDFATLANAWHAIWYDSRFNKACDLHQNSYIDGNDLGIFCEDWMQEK
ncbi:MAG: hypothetical protein ACYS8Z_01505 [Planctomycetota bacterium]|jgi:hypothetical protein